MTMKLRRMRAVLLTALALAAAVPTGDARAEGSASTPGWSFSLTPYLWVAGISGTMSTRRSAIPAQDVSAGFGDVLSHLNAIPIMGAMEVRYDRWGVTADLMAISVKAGIPTSNLLYSGGSARLTQVIGSAIGTYRVVRTQDQILDLGVGMRAFSLSSKITLNPGLLPAFERTPAASWVAGVAAVRYHIDLTPTWGVSLYGDIGSAGSSNLTWQVFGTVDYKWSESTSLRFGYRHLHFEYQGNKLGQKMSMSGPIIGATMWF